MSDFIGIYPNLAENEYCDRMVERFESLHSTASLWKGEDANGHIHRKDSAIFFCRDASDLAAETNSVLNKGLSLYMQTYPSLGMQDFYSNQVKVQKTGPKGGFHLWHCERSVENNAVFRNLVWTIYLNDVAEGEGETEFLEYGKKIPPKKGTVVFFPAAWTHTHRGNPVYTCDKYIATGWYYLSS